MHRKAVRKRSKQRKPLMRDKTVKVDKQITEKDFTAARREIERVIKGFRKLVGEEENHDPENTGLKNMLRGLKRVEQQWREQSFQVAVLALVKSGKSTLINALLGSECLPSSNAPETARIVRIRHEPAADEPVLEKASVKIATGVTNIRTELRSLNASQRKADSTPAEDELTLSAPIVCLAGRSLGEQIFEVLDTPGPNEAGADILRERVDGLLGKADVIIYLLDYTKLKTEEEKGLFARLSSMRPELLKRFSEHLFFVVNKIDLQNRSGLSQGETRDYVAYLLSEQVPGLTVLPERVLLVSAEQGLLARVVESGQADDGVRRDFAKRVFGELRGKDKTIEECQPAARKLLDESKLADIEEKVIDFIYTNRGRLFLQSVVDDLERHRGSFGNHLQTASESLNESRDELARKYKELEVELKATDREFEEVNSRASSVADDIKQLVKKRFEEFRCSVEKELRNAQGQTQSSHWDKVARFFDQLRGEVEDKKTAEQRLRETNEAIKERLRTEFDAFYDELKRETLGRQKQLFEEVESKLKPLARRIEEVVGQSLDISLYPVQIQIPMPSIDHHDRQIRKRKDRLIETIKRRMRRQSGTEPVMVKEGSWCGEDEYEERPTFETIVKETYETSHDNVLSAWLEGIDRMTENSVKVAHRIIKEEIQDATQSARSEIERYRNSYLQTMRRSLTDAERGEAAREKRLEEVKIASEKLLKLEDTIEKCREFLKAEA